MSDNFSARFFLPPDDYEILRFGGISVKDEKNGMETMLKHFKDSGLTEEQLLKNTQRYNLDRMFQMVKDYFGREYGYKGEQIELSNRYQRSINSYFLWMESGISLYIWMNCLNLP